MTVTVSPTTEDIWAQFPEHYRLADDQIGNPLKRFMSLLGDQADEVRDVYDLLAAGGMADAANAPSEWLAWMAQFVALDIKHLTVPEIRAGIANATALLAGSYQSLADTVASLLSGQKRYVIALHDNGDPFAIRVYANVADAGGSSWDTLALDAPSWNAWEAKGTWDNLFQVAPFASRDAFAAVKPAWAVLNIETIDNGHMWLFLELDVTSWTQWESQFASWDALETGVFPWP